MTSSSAPIVGDRYWAYLVARAVPAVLVAVFITFNADHSVRVGWISLAVFGILTGALLIIGSLRAAPAQVRREQYIQGVILALGGVAAIITASQGQGVRGLVTALAVVFILSGAAELVAGIRSRRTLTVARDWIFLGGLSVVFALAIVFIPVDYSQVITIPGKDVPNLTASVVVVGTLGAYAAIAAVYLVIAGLSLKWAKHPDVVVTVESAS